MASTDAEYHILRITIQIKKVMMAVRFPCTLQFQLRNGMIIFYCRWAQCG